MLSIFSTSFGRWQQRCDLSLLVLQQLVIVGDFRSADFNGL